MGAATLSFLPRQAEPRGATASSATRSAVSEAPCERYMEFISIPSARNLAQPPRGVQLSFGRAELRTLPGGDRAGDFRVLRQLRHRNRAAGGAVRIALELHLLERLVQRV